MQRSYPPTSVTDFFMFSVAIAAFGGVLFYADQSSVVSWKYCLTCALSIGSLSFSLLTEGRVFFSDKHRDNRFDKTRKILGMREDISVIVGYQRRTVVALGLPYFAIAWACIVLFYGENQSSGPLPPASLVLVMSLFAIAFVTAATLLLLIRKFLYNYEQMYVDYVEKLQMSGAT
jgi:hypothetical protein